MDYFVITNELKTIKDSKAKKRKEKTICLKQPYTCRTQYNIYIYSYSYGRLGQFVSYRCNFLDFHITLSLSYVWNFQNYLLIILFIFFTVFNF